MKITFFTPQTTPRLQYVLDFVGPLLGLDFVICQDLQVYQQSETYCIQYGQKFLRKKEVRVPFNGLLFENKIRDIRPEVEQIQSITTLFPLAIQDAHLSFDLFSAIFYLLSRYEEYLPFSADAHDRFPAAASLAAQHQFLEQPVVDQWIRLLARQLEATFPTYHYRPRAFQFRPSYDIDFAWAYRYKSWWRNLGAYAKALVHFNFKEVIQRLQVQAGLIPDPYDNFAWMDRLHEKWELYPLYFFLLGDYGPYDKNIDPQQTTFRQLIRALGQKYPLGIHPSYASNDQVQKVRVEKQRLEQNCDQHITRSRQHFLKLRFPKTYRQLIEAGLREDYSMGYADAIGFRAGTAFPFYWYDLEKETCSTLRVFPFQVMDVTLQQYLALSPEAALQRVEHIMAVIQQNGGNFCSLWHNSSLSNQKEWKGWQHMYEQLVEKACSIK